MIEYHRVPIVEPKTWCPRELHQTFRVLPSEAQLLAERCYSIPKKRCRFQCFQDVNYMTFTSQYFIFPGVWFFRHLFWGCYKVVNRKHWWTGPFFVISQWWPTTSCHMFLAPGAKTLGNIKLIKNDGGNLMIVFPILQKKRPKSFYRQGAIIRKAAMQKTVSSWRPRPRKFIVLGRGAAGARYFWVSQKNRGGKNAHSNGWLLMPFG